MKLGRGTDALVQFSAGVMAARMALNHSVGVRILGGEQWVVSSMARTLECDSREPSSILGLPSRAVRYKVYMGPVKPSLAGSIPAPTHGRIAQFGRRHRS